MNKKSTSTHRKPAVTTIKPTVLYAERPGPDPSDLAITDADEVCSPEPELLFRPRLRLVPE